jgi:hypothetical protein
MPNNLYGIPFPMTHDLAKPPVPRTYPERKFGSKLKKAFKAWLNVLVKEGNALTLDNRIHSLL